MAKLQGVWGIDIGQCGVKALRCLPSDEPGKVRADAFDYIEYPKILSQPEANPEEMVGEALKQFLSRNEVRGDRVAIAVPGQSGLARFVKLPPVEVKKIPDLVRYEARNQIPFDLDDVIWDYQQMGGGMIEEGFAIDIEIGLFAMKREQVLKYLKPFETAGIEVDLVQLTPLSLYNYVAFDQMQGKLPDPEFYDPENPPDSTMILSLGTETTDLVITDGFRVWQRSLPIGGSHFTKALTKELKQTYAKAEHIKRNAAQAENPKALFQAMRPVFADLVTEVQRSMNFFSNIHKKATIANAVALGNTAKLPGLVRFLSQNLKMPIQRVENYGAMEGPGIVDAPAFQENILAFPVCYGLCLQGLVHTAITTNLIPRELVTDRLIRAKKPWAVGALASLSLGLAVSYAGYWLACQSVREEPFKKYEQEVNSKVSQWESEKSAFNAQMTAFEATDKTREHLLFDFEKRTRWKQLFKAIAYCLPKDDVGKPINRPEERKQVFVTSVTVRKRDLPTWYRGAMFAIQNPGAATAGGEGDMPGGMKPGGMMGGGMMGGGAGGEASPPAPGGGGMVPDGGGVSGGGTAADSTASIEVPADLQGTGYVVRLQGYHFHNIAGSLFEHGGPWLNREFIDRLKMDEIIINVPDGKQFKQVRIPVKKLGILHPMITSTGLAGFDRERKVKNPWYEKYAEDPKEKGDSKEKGKEKPKEKEKEKPEDPRNPEFLARYDFIVELAWIDPSAEPKTDGGEKPKEDGEKQDGEQIAQR